MAVQQKQCFLKNINDPQKSILLNKDQINIGRGRNMQVCLLSVMISKHHATIKRIDEKWTITDENSMNGVFVNRKQLVHSVPCLINEGDLIQIGKSKDQPFSYLFQSRLVTKHKEGKLKLSKSLLACDNEIISKDDYQILPSQHKVPFSDSQPSPVPSSSGCSLPKPDLNSDCILAGTFKRKRNSPKSQVCEDSQQKILEYEKKIQEMQKRLKASEQALQYEKEISSKQAHVINALNTKMEFARKELEEVQESKIVDKLLLEEEIRHKSEIALQEKEEMLWKTLEEKKAALEKEMESIEGELRMKDIANQTELEDLLASKKRLEQILTNKEAEQKLLEKQLEEAKEASKQEKESALKIKEDVLSNFAELMETELQCSICSELFVQATSLSCTHSFCAFCLEEWMKRKKNCPVCRTPVTSMARAIVLDSYIEKMVSCFSEEMKERREQIIKERKELAVSKNEKTPWYNRRIIPHINAEILYPSMLTNLENQNVVWYEDLSEESLSDESYESIVDGVSGSYFGGYGRCYLCGQRGHWANGCPFQ